MNENEQNTQEQVSQAAAALGRRARGHAKRLTAGERARRRATMEKLNAARWARANAARAAVVGDNGGEKARKGGKDQ